MPQPGRKVRRPLMPAAAPPPQYGIGGTMPEVEQTMEVLEDKGSVLRPTWTLMTPALCAGAWLVGFAEFTTSIAGGDTLRGLLAVAALVLGAGLPILVTARWTFGAGTGAILGATVLGGVGWVIVLYAPAPPAVSALGLACGAAVGAVGIRAREEERAAVVPVASAIVAAIVAFAILRATGGVVAHGLTAIVGVITTVLTAIVLAVTATGADGWAREWPAAHHVVIGGATLAGAVLATAWLATIVGLGPAIYAGPVFLVAGALAFAFADPDDPGVVGATALVSVPVAVLAFIAEWLA